MNCADAALRWLLRATPNIDEAAAAIEASIDAIRRASDVVRSVQRLLNHIAPDCVDVTIDVVVAQTLEMMGAETVAEGIAVVTDLQGGDARVSGDVTLLQQVLVNLLVNARHALQCVEGRPRTLSVVTRTDGRSVILAVRDNGPGFAAVAQARAFEPFFSTKRDGMGVGLAICRSIIDAHGGEIAICSNEQRVGAALEIKLPAIRP